MRVWILSVSVVLACLSLASVAVGDPDPLRQGAAEVGKPLPHLAGFDLDGMARCAKTVLGTSSKGIVVQFMTVYCKACKAELKELVAGRDTLTAAGVKVLVVDLLDEADQVEKMLDETGARLLPLIRDRTGAIVETLKLQVAQPGGGMSITVPLSLVADGNGVVKKIFRGQEEAFVRSILDVLALGGK